MHKFTKREKQDDIATLLYKEKLKMENAEVILSNLLALQNNERDGFSISNDDVLVSIRTAIYLLQN